MMMIRPSPSRPIRSGHPFRSRSVMSEALLPSVKLAMPLPVQPQKTAQITEAFLNGRGASIDYIRPKISTAHLNAALSP